MGLLADVNQLSSFINSHRDYFNVHVRFAIFNDYNNPLQANALKLTDWTEMRVLLPESRSPHLSARRISREVLGAEKARMSF